MYVCILRKENSECCYSPKFDIGISKICDYKTEPKHCITDRHYGRITEEKGRNRDLRASCTRKKCSCQRRQSLFSWLILGNTTRIELRPRSSPQHLAVDPGSEREEELECAHLNDQTRSLRHPTSCFLHHAHPSPIAIFCTNLFIKNQYVLRLKKVFEKQRGRTKGFVDY